MTVLRLNLNASEKANLNMKQWTKVLEEKLTKINSIVREFGDFFDESN